MASEWESHFLTDIYEIRSGLSKPRSEFGFGHGFLTYKDVMNNYFVPETLGSLVNSTDKERESASVMRGDVFLTRTSETQEDLGMSAVALKDYAGATFNGFTKRLRPISKTSVIPEYAAYYFRSPKFRREVTAMSSLSTRASLNNDMIARLTITLPPIEVQSAIGGILKALDDKIELNRRMNATLESIARAIFKSWFVDFDPVRAKAEGEKRKVENAETLFLPDSLLDLFPSAFQDSELGKIPEGWSVQALGELIELAYGKALKKDIRIPGSVPVYGSNGAVGWHNKKLVDGPGIIVGRKGNPGVVKWSQVDFFPIDTTFYVTTKTELRSLHYLFYALEAENLVSYGADSAVPGLNRNMAYMSMLIVPSNDVVAQFDHHMNTIRNEQHLLEIETATLSALRDTLLPKLLSGELSVPATMLEGNDG